MKSRIANVSMLELMHQEQTNSSIAWKIDIHPNLRILVPKRPMMRSWSWGLTDNPYRIFFFWICGWTSSYWVLMAGNFGILESSATQWYQDGVPIQIIYFFIVASVVFMVPGNVVIYWFRLKQPFLESKQPYGNKPCVHVVFLPHV
jgi:hypothetical protein